MSDYQSTRTYKFPDYAQNNALRERWHERVSLLRAEGKDSFEAIQKAGHLPIAPLLTATLCNPLSPELRIILAYFWTIYRTCEPSPVAWAILADVRNLCDDLFSPANVHIHSEYGCKDDRCSAWAAGYEAGRESKEEE